MYVLCVYDTYTLNKCDSSYTDGAVVSLPWDVQQVPFAVSHARLHPPPEPRVIYFMPLWCLWLRLHM